MRHSSLSCWHAVYKLRERIIWSDISRIIYVPCSVHRWAVTGTPLSRGLEDLFGLFAFLKCSPYDARYWWMRAIQRPYESGKAGGALGSFALPLLQHGLYFSFSCWVKSRDHSGNDIWSAACLFCMPNLVICSWRFDAFELVLLTSSHAVPIYSKCLQVGDLTCNSDGG